MAAPYVSHVRLTENSQAAMLAAIEIYNKPEISYREEVTVVLIINAWELALKAALRKNRQSVFYKKARNQPYRSLSVRDALKRMSAGGCWPPGVDGTAVTGNLESLIVYRDCQDSSTRFRKNWEVQVVAA